ncbi:hypothetical protein ALE3EI_1610 [Constantimarinum furrinae]|uniref:Uncharacterized protein n=1 Tax=Constantimarinum furrinae TaxID=2562285 RepID=A0A7G8PUZ8_9FLAO|nr:hypothetical protein ALE3EI_1610 [Constantimarinum furrinae]
MQLNRTLRSAKLPTNASAFCWHAISAPQTAPSDSQDRYASNEEIFTYNITYFHL